MSAARSAVLVAVGMAGTASAAEWSLDHAHTRVGFKVRYLGVTDVHGEFRKFSGVVSLDEKDPTRSTVETTIETASIDTHDQKRDEHLRSPDFFDAAAHPTITFKSKRIQKAGKGYKVIGDLTIRGVTKEVTLEASAPGSEVKDPWGQIKRALTASTKLNRKDFGVSWNQALDKGGFLVGDEVQVLLEVTLLKKAQPSN